MKRTSRHQPPAGLVALTEVDIDDVRGGTSTGFFKGVDGLSAKLEVVEYQDGTDLFLRTPPTARRRTSD